MKRPGSAGKAKNQRLSARQRGSSGSGRKITAGKRAEYLRDLEFLSVSATRLLEPIPTNDLFRYIGRRLSLICGRAIVVVNEYDAAAGRIIVRAIAGPESKIRKVSAILGRDPVGLEFTLTEAIKSQLKKGVLTDLEGDLRERALPHLSIPVSERIQQELHLGRSHVMPLILQEKLLGTVAIVTDKSEGLRNSILLEAFINQAVLALNRHRVEDELRTTREWLGQAQGAANAGSWEFDIQSEKIIWTEELARLLNMPAVTPADTEIVRRIIHPDDLQSALDATYRSIETRTPLDIQFRVMTPEGGFRWVAAKGRTFYGDTGRPLRMFGTLFDITEHRKLDEQIRESLAQKDLLLKEVHHRVKKSLNVAIGILRLQAQEVEDDKAKEVLRETENRIKTISTIHEKVCESSGFAVVELREYLHSISTALLSLYGVRPDRIALTLDVDIAEMDADKAVPCGLILAELCSNALHHAFPENSKGEVSISFRSRETEYRLEVKDNGVGLPEEIDFRHTTTLGLRLVNLLVSQMRGTIDLNNANGACFTLTFPR